MLTSPQPLLMCPGNHDSRGPYREVLLHQPSGDGPDQRRAPGRRRGVRAVRLELPGRNDGYLDDETFAWLEGVVRDAGDAPVFICFHHPPVLLYSPFLDSIRQTRREAAGRPGTAVAAGGGLLCGHAHTAAATTFAGRPLLVAPGVVSTLRLPGSGRT